MAYQRFGWLPRVAVEEIVNSKLALIYSSYEKFCRNAGIEPAEYQEWKLLSDNAYKLAGI